MRVAPLVLMLVGACSFPAPPPGVAAQTDAPAIDAAPDSSSDAAVDATPDAPPDAAPDAASRCGDGIVDSGELCDPGVAGTCATSCGDLGTATCAADCSAIAACTVSVDPTTAWEISSNGTSWVPATLPFTAIDCDNCTRYFRTEVCDRPRAVTFQYASDNSARMRVNTQITFDQYFLPNYCTDEVCCNQCCDSTQHCLDRVTDPLLLSPSDLARFHPGVNTVVWELSEEGGAAGFYSTMTLTY